MNINSNKDLILNGQTEYRILISNNPDFYENYAKDEFIRLFKQATGITLSVEIDRRTPFSPEEKYISIGRTNFFKESGVTADYQELKRDGYKIVTKGNSLLLIGGGGYGTVYAVYGFFERQFDYRYYMQDEWKITEKQNDKLADYDVTDIPDIENRTGRFWYPMDDPDCAIRMRTFSGFGKMRDGQKFFGSWAHNHIKEYLPLSKYQAEHIDWYSPELTQLCLTNEEMWPEMVEQVKRRIVDNEKAEYFLLGQEDTPTFCGCPRCLEQIKIYGRSGIMMRFINHVAREIKEWIKDYDPSRKVYIGTFAYQKTQDPPVVLDEKGKYVPIDESVIPEDNVFIMLAILGADWAVPMNDPINNKNAKLAFDGWFSLTDNIIIWAYCSNFNRALGFFDNYHVLDDNYKLCKHYKFKWVYFESNGCKQGVAFQPMLCFVHSQMAWNTKLKSADLIDEFMGAYYKEAKPQVKKYFESMVDYYRTKKEELNKSTGLYHGTYIWNGREHDVYCKSFYKYHFLQEMFDLLTEGMNVIDNSDKYDKGTKDQLKQRIMLERLTIRYLVAEFFASDFKMEDYFAYLDEFEKECLLLNIKSIKSRKENQQVFEEWKKNFSVQK